MKKLLTPLHLVMMLFLFVEIASLHRHITTTESFDKRRSDRHSRMNEVPRLQKAIKDPAWARQLQYRDWLLRAAVTKIANSQRRV